MFSELLSLKEEVKVLPTNTPQPPSVGGGGAAGVSIATSFKPKQSTVLASVSTPPIVASAWR